MTAPSLLMLWATPRSTSTAFEWMMRQRGDFACFHEPWNECFYYGEDRRSDRDAHVAPTEGLSYAATWETLSTTAESGPVFIKDFVYSVEHALDDDMLATMTHSFLLRDPERVIQGLSKHWPDCTWEECGFESLHRLFHRIADRDGTAPPLIESGDLLADPPAIIQAWCEAVRIRYIDDALTWEPGERKEVSWYGEGTGPWHDGLRESSGFAVPTSTYPPIEDPRLVELHERARVLYDELAAHRLRP